jgi:hypothetical protein
LFVHGLPWPNPDEWVPEWTTAATHLASMTVGHSFYKPEPELRTTTVLTGRRGRLGGLYRFNWRV